MYIKVWCEYDIRGNFGANNDQEVLKLEKDYSGNQIDILVRNYMIRKSGHSAFGLSGTHGWEYITVGVLG